MNILNTFVTFILRIIV